MGRELIAAKAETAHGNWLAWLDDEFGWSERTARNYMSVAGAFKSASLADFQRWEMTGKPSTPWQPPTKRGRYLIPGALRLLKGHAWS